ncbi:MAG: universal stress protein [Spirochaetota bacterium]
MFNPKNILVPTDFSSNSEKAFQVAIDIAKQAKASITLLHVINVFQQYATDYYFDIEALKKLENGATTVSKDILKKMIDKFPETKNITVKFDVKNGDPYQEILNEQDSKKIDLIVIASHTGNTFLHHLLGSMTEKITRLAKCSVLVVKN